MLPFFEKKDTELFVYEYREFGFPAHFHPAMEVICAEEGEIGVVVEEESHLLHKGEVGVIFPDRVHHYEYIEGTNSKGYLLLLGKQLLGEYKYDMENTSPMHCIIRKEELHPHCVNAMEELRYMEGNPLRVQKAYAYLMLCHLFDKIELTENNLRGEDIIYRVVDYMEKHFCENISLEDVADALYISKYSLSRVFSAKLGQSFNDYLNNLRIRQAIELLEQGEKISSTAFESGFNNLRTFNRAFKKIMGKTPMEYIKMY